MADDDTMGSRMTTEITRATAWRGVNFYVTWPQCTTSPTSALASIMEKLHPLWCIVGQELHRDGSPHLHVCFHFAVRKTLGIRELDELIGHHGNYQICKDLKKVVGYCIKGGNYMHVEQYCFGAMRSFLRLLPDYIQRYISGHCDRIINFDVPTYLDLTNE